MQKDTIASGIGITIGYTSNIGLFHLIEFPSTWRANHSHEIPCVFHQNCYGISTLSHRSIIIGSRVLCNTLQIFEHLIFIKIYQGTIDRHQPRILLPMSTKCRSCSRMLCNTQQLIKTLGGCEYLSRYHRHQPKIFFLWA